MDARPPGPRGFPVLGMLPHVRRNPIRAFLSAADRYGDLVHMKLGPYDAFLASDPDDIKHVLQDNYRNYHKSPLYDRLKDGVGEGLITSEDNFWLRQRRLAQPAFHRDRLSAMVTIMAGAIEETVAAWEQVAARGRAVDLVAEMMDLTQRIIVRTMFSTELGPAAEVIKRTWPIVNRHIGEAFWATPFERRLAFRARRRFRRAMAELDGVVYQIIDERRRSGRDEADLLSMLLAACDAETGARMTDSQLRDEVITMLLAGHETTSLAMSWTFYLLGDRVEEDARVAREAADVFDGGPPSYADVERLAFTRMVINEALRLYPPAWGFSRIALADDRIGGYQVPAGSLVFILPYVVHRRPERWPDPERFDPERFTAERVAARPRFAYVPFGAGPRQCIGNQFALLEAQLILALLARRFRVELLPRQRIRPEPLITLRPAPGVRARVVARS